MGKCSVARVEGKLPPRQHSDVERRSEALPAPRSPDLPRAGLGLRKGRGGCEQCLCVSFQLEKEQVFFNCHAFCLLPN